MGYMTNISRQKVQTFATELRDGLRERIDEEFPDIGNPDFVKAKVMAQTAVDLGLMLVGVVLDIRESLQAIREYVTKPYNEKPPNWDQRR